MFRIYLVGELGGKPSTSSRTSRANLGHLNYQKKKNRNKNLTSTAENAQI